MNNRTHHSGAVHMHHHHVMPAAWFAFDGV